jgi:Co/Zn/Cd efflux system component
MGAGPFKTFEGIGDDDRRRLTAIVVIGLAAFVVETLAGQFADSQSLKTDALDFLAEGVGCAIPLWAAGKPHPVRSIIAIAQGAGLLTVGLLVAATTLYHFFVPTLPDAGIVGFVGLLALGANAGVVWMLRAHRDAPTSMRPVWLRARDDSIGNVAVIVVAGLVAVLGNGAPDLIVAGVMAALFLVSAVQMLRQGMTEWRELKEADAFPHREHSTPPEP